MTPTTATTASRPPACIAESPGHSQPPLQAIQRHTLGLRKQTHRIFIRAKTTKWKSISSTTYITTIENTKNYISSMTEKHEFEKFLTLELIAERYDMCTQSYFSMMTRTTSPCVHAPTCPLSQPHHSLPMHSNPRTTMMEVASQPSDEVTHLPLFVGFSFIYGHLGLAGCRSKSPIIIRDEKRREAREEVLVEEVEMHRNGSRKYEWLIPQRCTMHLWQVFMHF
ncbi:hypothetical protein VPH35_051393 [Triticum aestivum]